MKELDYSCEPCRTNTALIVRKDKPFNAEATPSQLIKHYVTPEALVFCRSHGPIPDIDATTHRVEVKGLGINSPLQLSVEQLKTNFEKKQVMMALQCAGNRRDGLHRVKPTNGVIWGPCAIANAVYGGCRLKDVLHSAGVTSNLPNVRNLHVAFHSVEQCEEDSHYGSSIPLIKALDEFGDVLLAYEMNGAPLTRDHGYPIRVVVPGYIGARSVKFLKSIVIQDKESTAYYQRHDYKILPENVENEQQAEKYWDKTPSIGEYNVQSFVCQPPGGEHTAAAKNMLVQGYALSGGGRSIQRVDVSGDDGRSWVEASLYCQPTSNTQTWSWCLWTARVDVKKNVRIVSRAVDSAGDIQQEYPVWNYRGVMNNAWRTVDSPHHNANL